MKSIIPPAAIQRGRKDQQYLPTELTVSACVAYVTMEAARNGGTLEIKDWDKLESRFQEMQQSGSKLICWAPMKKDSLGDLTVDFETGGTVPVPGNRYIQIVEKPLVSGPEPTQLKLIQ